MKKSFILLTGLLVLNACTKDKNHTTSSENCYETVWGINDTTTVLPLNDRNFWVYADSVWEKDSLIFSGSTLLKIDKVYKLDELKAVEFSSILPLLTIKKDTLYSTELINEQSETRCYRLIYPKFFSTNDSLQVDGEPRSAKYLYYSQEDIATPVGTFSNNIIFEEPQALKYILHEKVGIIKIIFYVSYDNQLYKRTAVQNVFRLT